jgi:EAL domain-containing protein (putative c-di-GMP-specific phosphodiesterase class I)/GGDEF domain-containing protein
MKHLDPSTLDDPMYWAEKGIINFQPIVNTRSLRVHGLEALTRLPVEAPFASIFELLDCAYARGQIHLVERILLKKAISRFSRWEMAHRVRLFCNIDNRVFDHHETSPINIVNHLKDSRLMPSNLCIEISERMPPDSDEKLAKLIEVYQKFNVRIAIDDFGRGYSGLQTLTLVNPHYVKIDQFFTRDIDSDPRKAAIVQNVVRMAHSLGLLVVAEGVERPAELRAVRDAGCDFVQGFLIARPTPDLADLSPSYASVDTGRAPGHVPDRIGDLILTPEPLRSGAPVAEAVARFKQGYELPFIPITDEEGFILGAVREAEIRHLIFGDYSSALLRNKGIDQRVDAFATRLPVGEISFSQEELVDAYIVAASNTGLILARDERYVGVLTNVAMLQLASERAVAIARDQNPLTALAGNQSIQNHVAACLAAGESRTLVFFDFDNFKPFNDKYGFEAGDRALLMFAEQLARFQHNHRAFIGHIGGDDFFASLPADEPVAMAAVADLLGRFRSDVQSLYHHRDVTAGGMWSQDRFGKRRFFPLLRASAVVMPVDFASCHCDLAGILRRLSGGKAKAKRAENGIILQGSCAQCDPGLDEQGALDESGTIIRNRNLGVRT